MKSNEAVIRIQEREEIIDIIDKWFLGRRGGKAEEWDWCKRGVISYTWIKELKKRIRNRKKGDENGNKM